MSKVSLTPPVGPGDHVQGPPRAPLTIVEYGDYECPRSGRAHAVLQIVLHELGDDARFVFRNFPLTDPHPRAQPAAEAAESVAAHGGEDAFWAMHDILFSTRTRSRPTISSPMPRRSPPIRRPSPTTWRRAPSPIASAAMSAAACTAASTARRPSS